MKPIFLLLLVAAAAAVLAQGIIHNTRPLVRLDVPAKRKLVEKALTLKAGDSFQMVTNLLGLPTIDKYYGGDFYYVDYHMLAWKQRIDEHSDYDTEYVRVCVDQSNRVVGVRIRVVVW